jgi:hypothetical protein
VPALAMKHGSASPFRVVRFRKSGYGEKGL